MASTAQKIKFSVDNYFIKYDQIRRKASDLVTFTEAIFNGKLRLLWSAATGPKPVIFGFQGQVALRHMYNQSSQHVISSTGKTNCHFSGSSPG